MTVLIVVFYIPTPIYDFFVRYKLETEFRLIVAKVQTHYDFLDGFMANADTTDQLTLEDYAWSIIQPGKY